MRRQGKAWQGRDEFPMCRISRVMPCYANVTISAPKAEGAGIRLRGASAIGRQYSDSARYVAGLSQELGRGPDSSLADPPGCRCGEPLLRPVPTAGESAGPNRAVRHGRPWGRRGGLVADGGSAAAATLLAAHAAQLRGMGEALFPVPVTMEQLRPSAACALNSQSWAWPGESLWWQSVHSSPGAGSP